MSTLKAEFSHSDSALQKTKKIFINSNFPWVLIWVLYLINLWKTSLILQLQLFSVSPFCSLVDWNDGLSCHSEWLFNISYLVYEKMIVFSLNCVGTIVKNQISHSYPRSFSTVFLYYAEADISCRSLWLSHTIAAAPGLGIVLGKTMMSKLCLFYSSCVFV